MRLPILLVLGLLASWPAAAADLPARRAGLWDIQILGAGSAPAMTTQHCIDAKTDQMMNALGGGMVQQQCSKQDVQRTGNTITVDSVCRINGATVVSHAVITGDFNKAYTVKVTSKRDGGDKTSAANSTVTIEAKWLSACAPDQRPGDIIIAGGRKINILDLKKMLDTQRPPGAAPPRP